MKLNPRRLVSTGALSAAITLGALAMSATAAPELSVQSEQKAHPRLVEAIHHMEQAVHELEAAPDDFGGNKMKAIGDTKAAIHSVKKALYYRLKLDDAAIDRAQ